MYKGNKGIIIVDNVFVMIFWNFWKKLNKVFFFLWFFKVDILSFIINVNMIVVVIFIIGFNGIVNIGVNIFVFGFLIWFVIFVLIKFGKINVDIVNDNNFVIKVELYVIFVVIFNNFFVFVVKLVIFVVIKFIIINGIINFRNVENKVLIVINICIIIFGV